MDVVTLPQLRDILSSMATATDAAARAAPSHDSHFAAGAGGAMTAPKAAAGRRRARRHEVRVPHRHGPRRHSRAKLDTDRERSRGDARPDRTAPAQRPSRHGPIHALGIASFGPVDLARSSPTYGFITSTPKPGWRNTRIAGRLARRHSRYRWASIPTSTARRSPRGAGEQRAEPRGFRLHHGRHRRRRRIGRQRAAGAWLRPSRARPHPHRAQAGR